ncbi:MAG: YetF domain-containing protein, partial [Bacteroidota bacterium]
YDEFFAGLRMKGVSHLGQVKTAILETTGEVSVFFFPDKEVKPGLCILPDEFAKQAERVAEAGLHACGKCGDLVEFEKPGKRTCKTCKNQTWVMADKSLRVD